MEEENIFLANRPKITLEDYLGYNCSGRGNLGEDVPVFVYRMLEYSLKEILSETYGKDVFFGQQKDKWEKVWKEWLEVEFSSDCLHRLQQTDFFQG